MNESVLDAFHEALVTESIVRDPYEIWRGAAKSRNNAVSHIPGWPQQRLKVPSRKRSFSLPWSDFPPTLEVDVESYLRRAAGLDLDDDMFSRAQRPATIETRRAQLRLFATALIKGGVPPESLVDLRAMLMPEVAVRGLQYLLERNNGSSSVQISNLADFLPTLGRRLSMTEEIVAKLRKMAKKLKVSQRGMTPRNREALRAFDDEAAVEALMRLPQRILREVQESE